MKRYAKNKIKQINMANKIIKQLFSLVESSEDKKLKNRYIEIARNIAMRFRIKLSSAQKSTYCKFCKKYLDKPKIRINGKIKIHCPNCSRIKNIHLK